MDKKNNIYIYKPPKSVNEEIHYFLTKGRITLKVFWLRFIFALLIQTITLAIYYSYALPRKLDKTKILADGREEIYDSTFKTTFYFFENFTLYILPIILFGFILIQLAKRIHDVNKSGWFTFAPFYNIILLFSKGTDGNNDFGINPRPQKQIKYFDELKK